MKSTAKAGLACIVLILFGRMEARANSPAVTIRSVSVLGAGNTLEVEVDATGPVQPQTQTITGPDRLILDFFNALPGTTLHDVKVDRGELKGVRIGRFSNNPPVTRVVLDLKSAQQFQMFPSGKMVIVKLMAGEAKQSQPATSVTNTSAVVQQPVMPAQPAPKVQVFFSNGKLRIWANKATLAEVLNEVHRRTGAAVTFPPGSAQDPIVADLGPAPARDVLGALLYGTNFNFVVVGSDTNVNQLSGIFLTQRLGGADTSMSYPAVVANNNNPNPEQPIMAAPHTEGSSEPPPAEPDMTPNQPPQAEDTPAQPPQ